MSNNRAERVVRTLKRSVARLMVPGGENRDAVVSLILFEYVQIELNIKCPLLLASGLALWCMPVVLFRIIPESSTNFD